MKFKDKFLNHVRFCDECWSRINAARSTQGGGGIPQSGLVCDASCWDFQGSKHRDGYFHGKVEWQAMDLATGEMVIQSHVQPQSTINIGEFLAIIDCLKYLNANRDSTTPVYSDSKIALNWVENRYTNTALPRNDHTEIAIGELEGGLSWLRDIKPKNPLLWWPSWKFGENPADYARK